MDRDELASWLRLQLSEGVGNSSARKLLAAFGLPTQIFAQSGAALRAVVGPQACQGLQSSPDGWPALVDTTWHWLQADPERRRVLTLGDPSYPTALLQMEDPPLLLYAMGTPAAFAPDGLATADRHSMAIVGSRNPTPQGKSNARQFAQALADAGLCIVSGLALGVDGAAHEGALQGQPGHGLHTIAVVGTGLDRVYPKQHHELAHRIAQHGVILSEYPLGTPPLSANFPRRNRLIAGLSLGTLVVEAALQSGSLITARLAIEQGKDVFAIPGSIHATQARGCHALIKQGAKLVESAQDVLEELQWDARTRIAPDACDTPPEPAHANDTAAPPSALGGHGAAILGALGYDPVGLDALQARTGLDTPTLQAQLMALELQGQIARLPGGLLQRMACT